MLLEIPHDGAGERVSLAQAWERIERVIPRCELAAALQQVSELVPDADGDNDAEWRQELVKRYGSVTGFLGLLARVEFGAVDARAGLPALRGLPHLVGRRRVAAEELDAAEPLLRGPRG